MTATDAQIRQARFWRKLLRLTRGRVTLLRALEVIGIEEGESPLKSVIEALRSDLGAGLLFSEAVAKQRAVFSLSVIELIGTAEKTGAWDEILQELAEGLDEGTFDG